jgi:hypothetical protein
MTEEETELDRAEREQAAVIEMVERRLDQVRPTYAQALSQLWFANAGGAVTVLSFIGAMTKSCNFPHQLLVPLWFFVVGLIFLGAGSGAWLFSERKKLRHMETTNSILDINFRDVLRPTETVGLTLRDGRTIGAIASAVLFVGGCIAGVLELTFANWDPPLRSTRVGRRSNAPRSGRGGRTFESSHSDHIFPHIRSSRSSSPFRFTFKSDF